MTIARAQEILKTRFGYDDFRMHQRPAIEAVLERRDCLLLMPTGGGKSVCYQIPAMIFDGLTLVISPLIALMKDQVDALRSYGINAGYLNSTQTAAEQVEVFRAVRSGELKLLYVAPERLLQSGDRFLDFLASINVSLFAIDEAHCISSWGHDFRPEYQRLSVLKREFPHVPLIALTATADHLVRNDILRHLSIPDADVFVSSFNRPNIRYTVEEKRDSFYRLLEFLQTRKEESVIVYCLSRASVDRVAEDLRAEGYAALPYHAGLDKSVREHNQNAFLNDEAKIVVATIAFGMGIDKSNVRFVVHMDLPKNIESYYQETGRAGRDGLPSDALLFYSIADVLKLKGFAEVEGDAKQSEVMLRKLDQMAEFGELRTCRRRFLLAYFSEAFAGDCGNCDNCNTEFETFDGTIIAQKALSAAVRTGQVFGVGYLIDLLRGSKSQKMRLEHMNLKTYGVGADISKEGWFAYFKDLIGQGYLLKSAGQYPTLSVTKAGMEVLAGQRTVELHKLTRKDLGRVRSDALEFEKDLFEELRRVRMRLAEGEGVPPYVVFSDATLIEMAAYLPQDMSEMQRLSGIGAFKLDKYCPAFLDVIRSYSEKNGLSSKIGQRRRPDRSAAKPKRKPMAGDTFSTTYLMFREGKSIDEIAKARGLTVSTIENHLCRFIADGRVRVEEIVKPEKIETIRKALFELRVENQIAPIKEHLGEGFSYGEIRAVMEDLVKEK